MITQTNWIVFTGAACSGKSTMISLFGTNGFHVEREVTRDFLIQKYGENIPFDEVPWASEEFQAEQLRITQEREKNLNPKDLILFDRGVPDTYTYAAIQGIPMEKIYMEHPYTYKTVFLFEPLPLIHDNVRKDSDDHVHQQYNSLQKTYQHFGYELVKVPRFSIDKEESIHLRQEFLKKYIFS